MSDLGLMGSEGSPQPSGRRHAPRRRRKHRRIGAFVAVALSLAVVGGLVAGIYFGGRTLLAGVFEINPPEDYAGPGSGTVVVEVQSGDSLRTIGERLVDDDVVASTDAFVQAAEADAGARGIQPGSYELQGQMAAADAVAVLADPSRRIVSQVQIPEGLRISQMVPRLAEQSGFTEEQVQAAIDDVEALGLPAYAQGNPEGFLFPATYDVEPTGDAAGLAATMVDRFEQAATSLNLEAGAAALGRTPLEVVTVASIVEREVARAEDMPGVSEVIYNRLDGQCQGVPRGLLQMDSTVHYAVNDYSDVFTTSEQRQVDSPYNTYATTGLPPGPIASPGEGALQAALSPSGDGSCFFSAVNLETGETKFAATPSQHAENVAELQAFCRESDRC